jgi:hypothetical protein
VPNIRTVAPSNRESIWQDRGTAIPLRGIPEGGGVGKILARFTYTPDSSHRCSNPNPNRPVAFDELMAADIVPELMYIQLPLGFVFP